MDERLYWLWLAQGLGFASARLHPLLEQYGGPQEIYNCRMQLLRAGLVSHAQQKQLLAAGPQQMEAVLLQHEEAGFAVVPYQDSRYPELLRQIADPPAVLYLQGEAQYLQGPLLLGLVGTRRPSAYGMEVVQRLGGDLARAGVTLVSGMADGLDSEAHKAAVAAGAPTVAVLGTAIDQTYPARNATLREMILKKGAVISEYPIGTAGKGNYFLLRNRIIAGLSRGVLVAEGRRRSGTLSTAKHAVDNGRDVFAVPGSIFSPLSEGTNWLLTQGAKPTRSAGDVLEEYGLTHGSAAEEEGPAADLPLSGEARALLNHLGAQPCTAQQLCAAAQLSAPVVMAALTELELAGLASQLAGRQFVRSGEAAG